METTQSYIHIFKEIGLKEKEQINLYMIQLPANILPISA